MANKIRTSDPVAKVASRVLSGDFCGAIAEWLAYSVAKDESYNEECDSMIEALVKSLAGSALSNRRA